MVLAFRTDRWCCLPDGIGFRVFLGLTIRWMSNVTFSQWTIYSERGRAPAAMKREQKNVLDTTCVYNQHNRRRHEWPYMDSPQVVYTPRGGRRNIGGVVMDRFLSLLCFASWLGFCPIVWEEVTTFSTKIARSRVRPRLAEHVVQSGGWGRLFFILLYSYNLYQLARELILPSSEHPIMCVRYYGVRVRGCIMIYGDGAYVAVEGSVDEALRPACSIAGSC